MILAGSLPRLAQVIVRFSIQEWDSGGKGGIRTHGTVTRTTVFEFYDSHADLCRSVARRVL